MWKMECHNNQTFRPAISRTLTFCFSLVFFACSVQCLCREGLREERGGEKEGRGKKGPYFLI